MELNFMCWLFVYSHWEDGDNGKPDIRLVGEQHASGRQRSIIIILQRLQLTGLMHLPCWINTLVMYYLLCGSERMWMISFASSSSKDSGRHAWNKNSQKHARWSTIQEGISGVFFLLSSSEYILPPDQHVSLPGNGFYLLLCHLKSQNHGFISKVKRLENYLFGSLATMFLLSDA